MTVYALETVAPREQAALPQDGWGWFLSNSGWIVGTESTLVVDTAVSERRTAWLREAVVARRAELGAGGPTTVVITHGHGDHANGASQYRDRGCPVLAAGGTAHEVARGVQRFPGILTDTPWGDVRMPTPVEVLEADRVVDLGDVRVTLRPCPRAAHTPGDLTVATSNGVLWAGDLVWNGATPFAAFGSVDGWLVTLDELHAEGHRAVVPGHGPPAGAAAIERTRSYLRWVRAVASAAIRGSVPAEAALADDPRSGHPWRDWSCPERDVANVMGSIAEQQGREFDIAAGIAAMLRARGGPIAAPG